MAQTVVRFASLEDWLQAVIDQKKRLVNPWVHAIWRWESVEEGLFHEVWIRTAAVFPGEVWQYAAPYGRSAHGDVYAVRDSKVYAAETFETLVDILRTAKVLILPGVLEEGR